MMVGLTSLFTTVTIARWQSLARRRHSRRRSKSRMHTGQLARRSGTLGQCSGTAAGRAVTVKPSLKLDGQLVQGQARYRLFTALNAA